MKRNIILLFIMIMLVCVGCTEQEKNVYNITKINNDEYIEAKEIELKNTLLKDLINNDWSKEYITSTFGKSTETIFENTDLVAGGYDSYYNYYLCKSIGIMYKANIKQIDCILIDKSFTLNKYNSQLIDNIDIATAMSEVKSSLGEPHFNDNELNIIGYKFTDFYIFFRGSKKVEQMSIYPKQDYDKNILISALTALSESNTFELWQDYDYASGESSLDYIVYKSKGLKVVEYLSPDEMNNTKSLYKLNIYGNFFNELDEKLLIPKSIPIINEEDLYSCEKWGVCFSLNKDFVFEHEKARVIGLNDIKERFLTTEEISKTNIESNNIISGSENSMSPNGNHIYIAFTPACRMRLYNSDFSELYTELYGVNNYKWLNDRYIIYNKDCYFMSPRTEAIAIYDCVEKKEIIVASEQLVDYSLSEVNTSKFVYKHTKEGITKNITVKYSFKENSAISIEK